MASTMGMAQNSYRRLSTMNGSSNSEKLVDAFSGLKVETPFGPITYRPQDHQSTMGAYVGITKNVDGNGVMVDYRYLDGANYQPSDADVKRLRPVD